VVEEVSGEVGVRKRELWDVNVCLFIGKHIFWIFIFL
jgi:hypothetical protein